MNKNLLESIMFLYTTYKSIIDLLLQLFQFEQVFFIILKSFHNFTPHKVIFVKNLTCTLLDCSLKRVSAVIIFQKTACEHRKIPFQTFQHM